MRSRTPDEATCAICGRQFDPSETEGWCPNPSCGEWQHPAFPVEDTGEDSRSSPMKPCRSCGTEVPADADVCRHCGSSPDEAADEEEGLECPDCSADLSGIPSDQLSQCPICMHPLGDTDPTVVSLPPLRECPNCGDGLRRSLSSRECPGCRFDLKRWAETPLEAATDLTREELERLSGAGVEQVWELHDTEPAALADQTGLPTWRIRDWLGDSSPGDSGPPTFTDCPNCGEELPEAGPGWGCPACPADQAWAETPLADEPEVTSGDQQQLAGAGLTTVGQLHATEPDTLSDRTELLVWRLTDLIAETTPEDSARSSTAASCPNCGEERPEAGPGWSCPACPADQAWAETPLETVTELTGESTRLLADAGVTTVGELHDAGPDRLSAQTGLSARQVRSWVEDTSPEDEQPSHAAEASTQIQRSPDELVFDVMGQEFTVTDGGTVGREVRQAMVRAGAPEDEAVYVHRKHIRIEAGRDGFRLTHIGQNDLTVNGQTVEKGATVPLGDGDEVGFSNVVTATVTVR